MHVDVERIRRDIEAIARCTQSPGNGASRPTFSDSWAAAVNYVRGQAIQCGSEIRIDAAGNVHARKRLFGWNQPLWLVGSHLDTVPLGGDYDGVAGVVVALELLRCDMPLELIIFAEEEGTTFGLGMLGSRAWTGKLKADQLASLRNESGQNYMEAGAAFGVDAARLPEDQFNAATFLGLIEVHIEQGPRLWNTGPPLAVVRAIAGRHQYLVRIAGVANHAGATSMQDRRDALAGAAEMMTALERVATGDSVLTVGRLINHPNAVNVIPNLVEFTIDWRAPDDATLARGDAEIRREIIEICLRRSLTHETQLTESIAACPMHARLCEQLAALANLPSTVSGALHDSAILAPHLPTAMLFIPSKGGISHNPAEFSRVEDIAAAADVVAKMIRKPSLSLINAMSNEAFVCICGRFFENSPWVAQRTWRELPFNSIADLHKKLCQTVASASTDEKIKLIQAHPDLVGRLAQQGKLTRESTSEQAAAGLNSLSAEDIAAFERNNAAYKEKFGFPFVICARQNRKEAILSAFPRRLKNSRDEEIATALSEIYKIAQLRLADAMIWEV